jgi:hypothetical protein
MHQVARPVNTCRWSPGGGEGSPVTRGPSFSTEREVLDNQFYATASMAAASRVVYQASFPLLPYRACCHGWFTERLTPRLSWTSFHSALPMHEAQFIPKDCNDSHQLTMGVYSFGANFAAPVTFPAYTSSKGSRSNRVPMSESVSWSLP